MEFHRAWLLALASILLASPLRAAERLVLVIDNRSSNPAAAAEMSAALSAALARKGYQVMDGGSQAGSLTSADAAGLLRRLEAKSALAVTVRFFLEPSERARGPKAGPAVGLTATAFSAQGPIWRNSLGVIGAPEGRPLAAIASARLLWSFPRVPGAALASAEEEWNEMTGATGRRATAPSSPDDDVLIRRQRATRPGPRFPLRMRKKDR